MGVERLYIGVGFGWDIISVRRGNCAHIVEQVFVAMEVHTEEEFIVST